jgi:hypothetical protein
MPILGIFSSAVVPVVSYKFAAAGGDSQFFLSTDGITWEWPAPDMLQTSTATVGVDRLWYLNGKMFGLLQTNGDLVTSTNGTTWTYSANNIELPSKIIWDGTYYVAAVGGDAVAYSTDSTTWTYSNFYNSNDVQTVAYNSGTYVMMGNDNACYTSTNLVTWTSRTTGAASTTNWQDVTYGDKWVAVGSDSSTSLGRIRTSTDGIDWDNRSPSALNAGEIPKKVVWNGTRYVIATDIVGAQSSTDGVTWATGTDITGWTGNYNSVNYGGGNWILCSAYNGRIHTSTNGTSWTTVTADTSGGWDGDSYDAIYDGSKWVIGAEITGNTYNYWTSTNLTTFTGQAYLDQRRPTVEDFIWDGSQYVSVGQLGYLAVSTNATSWTSRTSTFGTTAINGIFYGNGTYVAVGSGGQLRTSTDTITWTSRTSNFATSIIQMGTYGGGVYVIVGNSGKIASSTDAVTWTSRTSNFATSTIYDVAYNSGLFVAVGNAAKISTSTDGTTWTSRTSNLNSSASIRKLKYNNGLWVATTLTQGLANNYTTSTDGITWTARTTPQINSYTPGMYSLDYSSSLGLWVLQAVPSINWTTGNYSFFTSTDAITWTLRTSDKIRPNLAPEVTLAL